MEMHNDREKRARIVVGRGLINRVFSWSIKDVLNNHIYKNQVKQIPKTFSSTSEYLSSFTVPLLEETRSDLSSSATRLSHSLCCQIQSVRRSNDFKLPKDLFYDIVLKPSTSDDNAMAYELVPGSLIAISSVRPKQFKDLERSYVIAYVKGVNETGLILSVLSSKPISMEGNSSRSERRLDLFAVYLINLTTNIRIWHALTCDPLERNMKIVEKVLQNNFIGEEKCRLCQIGENNGDLGEDVEERIRSSGLNESQQNAVLSCVGMKNCKHKSMVKLIWGPPGTGKTTTVSFLLHTLLGMRCRTLTCAPTNVAVLEVTERLVKRVTGESGKMFNTYGLGDIVLFGNGERMKIDDHDELNDVFLDHRIEILGHCFAAETGWRDSLLSMISLLQDPQNHHGLFLKIRVSKSLLKTDSDSDDEMDKNIVNLGKQDEKGSTGEVHKENERKKALKKVITQTLKENKNKNKNKKKEKNKQSKEHEKKRELSLIESEKDDDDSIFQEFLKNQFNRLIQRFYFCIVNLSTHLPTSLISRKVVNTMFAANESLESFEKLLRNVPGSELKNAFEDPNRYVEFERARMKSIRLLKLLPSTFRVPFSANVYTDVRKIREFFIANACLVFCTVSSSAKLHQKEMNPWELLVIDEAAQLKECESTIPLTLPGIRHAILVGDERQLPAMVQSKLAEEAGFGRSLFERLASLGHKKHLLNIQHRMHPSISLFPNREFYDNKLLNGPNVTLPSYKKTFLPGTIFGPYSFINVTHGKKAKDNSHSSKNMVEVAVVSELVETLYKEVKSSKKKVRVGVISPYKAQVFAITEKLGEKYSSDPQSEFSVSVRSIDGFQGGEEDVIIFSTVRSNGDKSVGFLTSRQRLNVALTRARHCLWIVGNGSILGENSSLWNKIIVDAKKRRCFHDAVLDKKLSLAIVASLFELKEINSIPNIVSLLFREAKWKVRLDDAFWKSMDSFKDSGFCKEVLSVIDKLSCGWRQEKTEKKPIANTGKSSKLVELYKVKQRFLVWAVDTQREISQHTQILKFFCVLKLSDVTSVLRQLDLVYGSYSDQKMSRCKHKRVEENMVVPMTWEVGSNSDEDLELFAWLSLEDK